MDYKNINDYEVLYLIEDENDSYKNILYDKYRRVIERFCDRYMKLYSTIFVEKEDLYQEALLGIDYAISHFDFHRDVTFYTYCNICIESKIKDYYQKLLSKRNFASMNSISLDMEIGEDLLLCDTISSRDDVCRSVLFGEDIKRIIDFKNSLSISQARVFELRMNGFSYKEIATLLSISIKSVYSHLRTIKLKYNNSL